MKPPRREDLERYRMGYLELRRALYDRATGLPAFMVHFDRLRTLLDRRKQIGVLHLEVVNLEMVESIYGWQVFDRIVSRIAGMLRQAAGRELPEGTLLAVNGVAGDRFVAFVPSFEDGRDADAALLVESGAALCERLEQAFESEDLAGLSPRLCFRTGHALLSVNPFHRFERSVYAAVEEARAFHEQREQRREMSWSEELQRIIHDAAIDTVFQPVVDLETRDVLGYEAFVRGPQDSMFEQPRTMFALSDRFGVSVELDRACCEAALSAFGKLADRGKVFLNVLPSTFEDADWCRERLGALLDSLALEPKNVVLEVTERVASTDPEPLVAAFERLRSAGFGLAFDDVGTGRIGLEVIERARPDYVKLDVSLVRDIQDNLIQQEVLLTLVLLARRIGAAVIAEGVESEEEAATLLRFGARYAQGYLFAVPAAADSLRLGRRPRARGH